MTVFGEWVVDSGRSDAEPIRPKITNVNPLSMPERETRLGNSQLRAHI